MSRIVSVCTASYHPYTLDDALKGISAAGFKYVELSALGGWMEDVMPDHSFRYLCEVKEKLQKYDLKCVALSGHCSIMDEKRLPDFITNISLAEFFGAEVLVTSIDEAHGNEDNESSEVKDLPSTLENLGELCRKSGLKLSLETHGEKYGTGKSIKELLSGVACDNVNINYDPGNVIFYTEQDPVHDLKSCADRVGYMHLKDKAGPKRIWDFPALGEGYVQLPELIDIVDKDVILSVEIQFVQEGPSSLEEVNIAVRKSYDYLKSIGVI